MLYTKAKMGTYAKRLYAILALILVVGIIFFVGKCAGKQKAREEFVIDSVRSNMNKRILEKETDLRDSEKQLKLLQAEKEAILKRESRLKTEIANTKKIKDYKPKYVQCDTTKAVAEESYNELKQGAETVEKQRDSASVLLDEKEKLIANTAEAEKAEDIAQNGIIIEKDKQLSLEKKEAKKAKRKAFWNGVKTTLVVVGAVIVTIIIL